MTGKYISKIIKKRNQEDIKNLFEQIYKKYFRLLYFVSFGYLKNEQNVEDVVQNIFVIFFQKCFDHKFISKINDVKSYLCTCARNDSIREIKKLNLKDESIDINNFQSSVEKHVEHDLRYIISNLNDEEIDLLNRHIFLELSFKEIANELNSSINTVKSKYRRAILKIRKKV